MSSPKYLRDRRWAKDNPERYERIRKRAKLKHTYGISLEEFEALLKRQGGCCAICKRRDPEDRYFGLRVDHCHNSSKVRGLLCGKCNQAIGLFDENVESMRAAIKYLRKHR